MTLVHLQLVMPRLLPVLVAAALLHSKPIAANEQCHVYVAGTNGVDCPEAAPCYNLSDFFILQQQLLTNNTVVCFLAGTHSWMLETTLNVSWVSNLTLRGLGAMEPGFHWTVSQAPVFIQCHEGVFGGFVFNHCRNIVLSNVTLTDCGLHYRWYAQDMYFKFSPLVFQHTINITVAFISIQNGTNGIDVKYTEVLLVQESSFANLVYFFNNSNPIHTFGLRVYKSEYLEVSNSNYSFSFYGIYLVTASDRIIVSGVIACYNLGTGIWIDTSGANVTIESTNISYGGRPSDVFCQLNECANIPEYTTHGGLYAKLSDSILTVRDSKFCSNFFGAIHLSGKSNNNILFSSCVITDNFASSASGVGFYARNERNLTFNNLTYVRNYITEPVQTDAIGVIHLESSTLNCTNVNVHNHTVSGVVAVNSKIFFNGTNNSFKNNTSISGGAVYLSDSRIVLLASSVVLFESNCAVNFGGAVYSTTNSQKCRIQSEFPVLEEDRPVMKFKNNWAYIAGDAIYGGNVEQCLLHGNWVMMDTHAQQDIRSVISSKPNKVSLGNAGVCTSVTSRTWNCTIYPNKFFLDFLARGQMNGTTQGVVFVESDIETNASVPQGVTRYGSSLQIPVYANDNHSLSYIVYGTLISGYHNTNSAVALNMTVLQCPKELGFGLEEQVCVCRDVIKPAVQNCSIDTLELTSLQAAWIGLYNTTEHAQYTVVYKECPFDYCNSAGATFNIQRSPDLQCNYNRSGTLCGGCAKNMSLLLGSNSCAQCTNDYLALIIAFALAGPALVAFLFLLNLTVTVGTINGLIFYANIVKLYEPALHFYKSDGLASLLAQFVAWINLDLGIDVCFYDGMDAVAKVGLQFVFPVYLWVIILSVIYICRHSLQATRLLAHRSVQVLATLLLLSYVKLIRAIILALYLTYIDCYPSSDSDPQVWYAVWYVDANLRYLGDYRHILIFVLALLFLVFFILPYTLCLLVLPVPERFLIRQVFHLKNQFLPLYQAYTGIYDARFKWWPGALLVVRLGCGLVVSFMDHSGYSLLVLGLVMLVSILPIMVSGEGLYEKRYLTALEYVSYLNVIFIACMQNFPGIDSNGSSAELSFHDIITICSMGLACLTFFLILFWHCCWYVCLPFWTFVKEKRNNRLVTEKSEPVMDSFPSDDCSPSSTVLCTVEEHGQMMVELREPLLDLSYLSTPNQ